ncbi:MAG: oligosaccharide flippase family protein [Chitinophagales bacterium]
MSSLKKVLENTFLYSLTNILLRATSIIFFPIFSSYLIRSDYGILSFSQSVMVFTSIFSGLELSKAITRFTYKKNEVKFSGDELISNTLTITLITSVVTVVPLLFVGQILLRPVLSDIPFYPFISLTLVAIPFKSLIDIYREYLKANHEGKKVFYLDMGFFGCNIGLNLFFVIAFDMHSLGIIVSTFVSCLIFAVVLWFVFYRKIKLTIHWENARVILNFSLPLIPFAILNALFDSTDKMFLNSKHGSSYSGIYYIAITFAGIFSVTKEAITSAITPWIYNALSNQKNDYIRNVISSVFLMTGLLAIAGAWFSKEVLSLLASNKDLIAAYKYIPLLVSGLYVIFLGQLFNIKTIYFGRHSRYLFVSTLIGIVFCIASCFIFIQNGNMGILGAALARFIGYLALVVTAVFLSRLESDRNEIYDIPFLTVVCVIVSALIFFPLFLDGSIWQQLFIKSCALAVLLAAVLIFVNKKFDLLSIAMKKFKNN